MAEVTEIYTCKEGQQLKEGKLEVSQDISGKEDAEYDAKQRCNRDNTIHRVAYYHLNDMGDFRVFYSYTNPHPHVVSKAPKGEGDKSKKKKRRKKKPKPTLMGKIKKLFTP